jgi:hypothetical protein
MSVNARVVLLVGGRHDSIRDGYIAYQRKGRLSHPITILTSPSAFGSPFFFFFERFFLWEPTSVDVIIVLLVEDDLTLYMMVTIVPTKR